jgi:hypothetical protein
VQIERHHNMVNRWNKAIAVGLRHNHDISFIGTQSKTIAMQRVENTRGMLDGEKSLSCLMRESWLIKRF